VAAAVRGVARATVALSCALTALMLGVLGWQVFMRSVLNAPPSWTEEVALLAFSWAVLLAMAYGVREGIHVRMDMLLDVMPPALRRGCERLILAAVVFVGLFLAYAGWHYTRESADSTSAAIGYPMPLLYASTVVCGVLIVLFGLERLMVQGEGVESVEAAGPAAADEPLTPAKEHA
jgi:TRAP-type C4-dicarboxylate transport system permease small subunit